ncbi:MAG TPA: hypothetical protein VFG07_04295 [Thermoplasmata archaeon]|nr:hypothetical protein [Thermoplasmata archaeon]
MGSAVRVLIPGTDRTYENREVLRGMGLRWDPPTHAWHGSLTPRERDLLRERFGLAVRPVVTLESFPARVESLPKPPEPPRGPSPAPRTVSPATTPRVIHDGSRTRSEGRIAHRDAPEELAEPWEAILGSRFSLLDVTSGLSDDSREADERCAERQLRDLRGRVKAARACVAQHPGMVDSLRADWRKATWFYTRWGITEAQFRSGTPSVEGSGGLDRAVWLHSSQIDAQSESHARGEATFLDW